MFVLNICRNVLLDDLPLEAKEFIVQEICFDIVKFMTSQERRNEIDDYFASFYSHYLGRFTERAQKLREQNTKFNTKQNLMKKALRAEIGTLVVYFQSLVQVIEQLDEEVQQNLETIMFSHLSYLIPLLASSIQHERNELV